MAWLAKAPDGKPFERPKLTPTCLVQVSVEDASDLEEAGLALPDDVMAPRGARAADPNAVDILLRLANLPEFAAEFEAWVDGPWTEWAQAEAPRRKSIAFYNRMFEAQQRMEAMGDDVPSEAVMGVGMARWAHPIGRVNAPLIETAVELELDPEDGSLLVRPRQQAPRLALRPFDLLDVQRGGKAAPEGTRSAGAALRGRRRWLLALRTCHLRARPAHVPRAPIELLGLRA